MGKHVAAKRAVLSHFAWAPYSASTTSMSAMLQTEHHYDVDFDRDSLCRVPAALAVCTRPCGGGRMLR